MPETSCPQGRWGAVNTATADPRSPRRKRQQGRLYVSALLCVTALVGGAVGLKATASAEPGSVASAPASAPAASPAEASPSPQVGDHNLGNAPYQEKYRPQVHFSPAKNWMNDPNGLIYYKGQYHMFFQYNQTEAADNDPVSWGHAVSTDLVHWKELPVAIPFQGDEMVFSGSVVFDKSNTSGLGTAENPPLVAIFTTNNNATKKQTQTLAYSIDDGTTWTRYTGNPVLDIDSTSFRDPKVSWYEPTKSWLMPVSMASKKKIAFYSSKDLKTWQHLSDFGPAGASGGEWECPDLFPMNVDDNPQNTKWVLLVNMNPGGRVGGSATQYFTGTFDGTKFTSDNATGVGGEQARWLDFGADFYAGVTYGDATGDQRIVHAWMSNWLYGTKIPTSPWRGAMTTPRKLSLKTVGGKTDLFQQPVSGLAGLHGSAGAKLTDTALNNQTLPVEGGAQQMEIETVLQPTDAQKVGVNVRTGGNELTQIGYDAKTKELYIDRTKSGDVSFHSKFPAVHRVPVALKDGQLKLRLIVDSSSVEVFANDGEVAMTDQIFPDPASTGLSVFADGGNAQVKSLTAWNLASIWKN